MEEETPQQVIPGGCGDLDGTSAQSKSYDTIGTIPCVHADTAAVTPGETTEAYVARSTVEVRHSPPPGTRFLVLGTEYDPALGKMNSLDYRRRSRVHDF